MRRRAIVLVCVQVLLATLVARVATAAPFDPLGDDWEGLGDFVRIAKQLLGEDRVVPASTLDLHKLGREDGVVLVHPERAIDVEELGAFMRAGGRLTMLDDYGTGDGLLAHFQIQRVPLPGRPADMLRGNPALAIATPAGPHTLMRDVARVVTNHATGVAHPALSPVLVVKGEGEPDVLLGLSGAVGRGRLVVVGDPSILINSMLRYPGNRAFAANLVRYATEDDGWGKREGKLYVLANGFETTGSFGEDSDLASVAGDARRALGESLESLRHDGMPPAAAYLLAIAVCLGVVVWTSTRAGRTHKETRPRFVRPAAAVARGGVAGHAAIIGAPNTSRVLAMLELKSALEEELATRLGLDRALQPDELVRRVKSARLLGEDDVRALDRLLTSLVRIESMLVMKRRGIVERVRDADVRAVADRVRQILDACAAVPPST